VFSGTVSIWPMRWTLFGCLGIWLIAVSARFGADQWSHWIELNRHYHYYGMDPFSNVIQRNPPPTKTVAFVNAAPFVGASQFAIARRKGGTLVLADRTVLPAWRGNAQCTCGVPPIWLATIAAAVPTILVLIGLAAVAMKRSDLRRWIYLALLLSLSTLSPMLWETRLDGLQLYERFFNPADVRDWDDAMRIPTLVQQTFFAWSWPAWGILFFARRRWSRFVAIPFLSFAILRTVLAVAWSEYYPPFVPLYRMVLENQFEFILLALGSAVLFGWMEDWRAGTLLTTASLAAIWDLALQPPMPTFSRLDEAMRPILNLPERGPEVLRLATGVGLGAALALLFIRRREAAGALAIATVLTIAFADPFPFSRYSVWYLASLALALPLSFPWHDHAIDPRKWYKAFEGSRFNKWPSRM
jgi:hypothetical protein